MGRITNTHTRVRHALRRSSRLGARVIVSGRLTAQRRRWADNHEPPKQGRPRNSITSAGLPSTRASGGRARWRECGGEAAPRGRWRGRETASQRGAELAGPPAFEESERPRSASPRSDQWWRQRRRRTPDRGALADLRTSDLPNDIRRPPRPQSEPADSPPAQFRFRTASHVLPGNARRLPGHHAAGSPLNFSGPSGFDVVRMLGFGVVQAGQEFGCNISALVEGQREGVPQKCLRS